MVQWGYKNNQHSSCIHGCIHLRVPTVMLDLDAKHDKLYDIETRLEELWSQHPRQHLWQWSHWGFNLQFPLVSMAIVVPHSWMVTISEKILYFSMDDDWGLVTPAIRFHLLTLW